MSENLPPLYNSFERAGDGASTGDVSDSGQFPDEPVIVVDDTDDPLAVRLVAHRQYFNRIKKTGNRLTFKVHDTFPYIIKNPTASHMNHFCLHPSFYMGLGK
jgi:hypothetical protein